MTATQMGARSAATVAGVGIAYAVVLAIGMVRHGLVWPSATYAIELFAWDLLLGLALVLAARATPADEASHRLRHWLRVTGALCLAGLIGPFVGNMRLQLIGVLYS